MSNGAPFPNAQGDINQHLLHEVSKIKECIGNIEGDIKEIKTYITVEKQTSSTNSDRKFKLKSGVFLAAIASVFGLIGAFVSRLFSS